MIKWLGNHVVDFIARFRSDVYLEDISTGTIASGGNLGLDSNNKIVKAVDGGGDITSVVAGTNLSGGATSGAATVNLADASTSVKGAASFSSDNFAASSGAITIKDGGVDLTAEVTGVLPSANMDADTAHLSGVQTFTGSKVFNEISHAVFDRDKTVTNLTNGAVIHVDAHTITNGSTSASGTATVFRHVSIESPLLAATNLSVTTTDAATLYIKGPPVASTNQAITNPWALWVDSGNARFDGDIDLEGDIDVNGTLETDALTIGGAAVLAQATEGAVGAVELATTGEADTGTDTGRAVTPAGLKSHVDTRYAYSYMAWSASGVSSVNGSDAEWVFPNSTKGIYEEDWNKDENITATSVGTTTYTVSRNSTVNGFVIPHTGICVGFHAHGRNDDNDVAFKTGLFHLEGSTTGATNNGGVDYGNTGTTHEATLRWIATAVETEASGGADGTSGHSFKGPCKLVSNTDALAVTAGDVLLPAIMGPDASDEIFITMTIILKIPLA